jgi:hypothetical protein
MAEASRRVKRGDGQVRAGVRDLEPVTADPATSENSASNRLLL